jgi:hypothetical protein
MVFVHLSIKEVIAIVSVVSALVFAVTRLIPTHLPLP